MNIIGISAYYHDSAAALLVDGVLVAAAQEERFSRKKHDPSFPEQAIHFILKKAGLSLADIDFVVFYDKPLVKFERLLETYYGFAPKGLISFITSMPVWLKHKHYIAGAAYHKTGKHLVSVLVLKFGIQGIISLPVKTGDQPEQTEGDRVDVCSEFGDLVIGLQIREVRVLRAANPRYSGLHQVLASVNQTRHRKFPTSKVLQSLRSPSVDTISKGRKSAVRPLNQR